MNGHNVQNVCPDVSVHGMAVELRRWASGYAPELQDAVVSSRAHLDPWMPWTPSYEQPGAAERFIAHAERAWNEGSEFQFAIIEPVTGRVLGSTGFSAIDRELRQTEIGYWLRADAEGRGYATESARLLTTTAFDTLDMQRVEIRCDPRNERSRAVAERLGYMLERRIADDLRDPSGVLRDTLVFVMTPERWRSSER